LSLQTQSNAIHDLCLHCLLPVQNPQIAAARVTDYGPLIVGIEIDDPVIPPEWPEKRDFELGVGLLVNDTSLPLYRLDRSVCSALTTLILNPDQTIISQGIFCAACITPLLEPVGKTRYFVPYTGIALQINPGDSFQRRQRPILHSTPAKSCQQ